MSDGGRRSPPPATTEMERDRVNVRTWEGAKLEDAFVYKP